MIIKSLQLHNYRRFKDLTLTFQDGVIGMIGYNGTGKSTILEAVAWALYGNETSIVRTTKNSIRYDGAKVTESCGVKLIFEMNNREYAIHRQLRGKTQNTIVTARANNVLEADGSKAVKEYVNKLLGMGYKSFFTSVFARQKELDIFTSEDSAKRKKRVLKLLGIEHIDLSVDKVHERIKDLKIRIEERTKMLTTPEGKDRTEQVHTEINECGDTLDIYGTEMENIDQDIE